MIDLTDPSIKQYIWIIQHNIWIGLCDANTKNENRGALTHYVCNSQWSDNPFLKDCRISSWPKGNVIIVQVHKLLIKKAVFCVHLFHSDYGKHVLFII